jgi:hypothetical protein
MDPTPQQPITPSQPRPGWWSRNWKWFVPAGCLTFFAMIVAFVAIIIFVVFAAMKQSDVYKTAVARAKSDPRVVEALGTPIDEGMFVSGSTHVNGAAGDADLSIPISGPKGKATVYVAAKKSVGRWEYEKLEVEIDKTKERIDLATE